MALFDGIFGQNEKPEVSEETRAALKRNADNVICVHATAVRLAESAGRTVIVLRTAGHTKDQEDAEDKDFKVITDYAFTIEDMVQLLANLAECLEAAMMREDPMAAMLASLITAMDQEEATNLN